MIDLVTNAIHVEWKIFVFPYVSSRLILFFKTNPTLYTGKCKRFHKRTKNYSSIISTAISKNIKTLPITNIMVLSVLTTLFGLFVRGKYWISPNKDENECPMSFTTESERKTKTYTSRRHKHKTVTRYDFSLTKNVYKLWKHVYLHVRIRIVTSTRRMYSSRSTFFWTIFLTVPTRTV